MGPIRNKRSIAPISLIILLFLLPQLAIAQLSGGGFTATGVQLSPVVSHISGGTYNANVSFQPAVAGIIASGGFVGQIGAPQVYATGTGNGYTGGGSGGGGGYTQQGTTTPSTGTTTQDTLTTPTGQAGPQVYNVQVRFVSDTEAIVTFDTSKEAGSGIAYSSGGETKTTTLTGAKSLTHVIRITGLKPNTAYTYSILTDFGNEQKIVFSNQTYGFRTAEKKVEAVDDVTEKASTAGSKKSPAKTATKPAKTTPASTQDPETSTVEIPLNTPSSPPACPEQFAYTYQDSSIVLTWKNPVDPKLAYVVLVKSMENFPRNKTEGTVIYEGLDENFTDTLANTSVPNYYTLFSSDSTGQLCLGSPLKTTPPELQPETSQQDPVPELIQLCASDYRQHSVFVLLLLAVWLGVRLSIRYSIKKLLNKIISN